MAAVSSPHHPSFRRPPTPLGARVRLLLLAPGEGEAACIDLDTGGLVWAVWDPDPDAAQVVSINLRPLDVVSARTVANPNPPDPSRPETIELVDPPVAVGRLRGRRAQKLLTPLHHPERDQVLGFAGPAIPYWTLIGDHPSMTIVNPYGEVVLVPTVEGLMVRFRFRGVIHELPCTDAAAAAAVTAKGGAVKAKRRLLVTLSAPYMGHCYKVVPALLPGAAPLSGEQRSKALVFERFKRLFER